MTPEVVSVKNEGAYIKLNKCIALTLAALTFIVHRNQIYKKLFLI
jgi:hypothetical protein